MLFISIIYYFYPRVTTKLLNSFKQKIWHNSNLYYKPGTLSGERIKLVHVFRSYSLTRYLVSH